MPEVYLFSVQHWLHSLTIACAVLSDPEREVYFIDPELIDQEIDSLEMLKDRLLCDIVDVTGSEKLLQTLAESGLSCLSDPLTGNSKWQNLLDRFGQPRGICAAAADSPADCLKAASMAVRLGFYFLPLGKNGQQAKMIPRDIPLTWFGQKDELAGIIGQETAASFTCLANDMEVLAYLTHEGCPVDYLVILNSADLFRETEQGDCLGDLWVKGLSLHALTLASYRRIYLFDAATANPDPRQIEMQVNKMVQETGMSLRFQAVLASPAVVPFFYEEKKAIGAVTEEMIRDIHIRLNGDLFFDLAEGRLMQHNPGGLSTQLITTKHYPEIQKRLGRSGRDILIVSTPHVDTGIIFSTDEALIDTQLAPLLKEAGYNINLLQYQDAHYQKVSEALTESDFLLYTGHGGPEGLHTHGRTLNRADLPVMVPLVTYASACSTVALVPHWYSSTEGLEWQGVPVDSRQVIGLSFIEKGAICFVGGATVEDLQYTTSTYSIFMDALLLKGLSVGEAVQEMRHVISLYAATLLQKNPEEYRKYRWGTANAIHQQVLLGDPAFTPSPKKNTVLAMPRSVEGSVELQSLTVEIPPERWRRSQAQINPKDASKYYYRCRNVEVITPYGEDVFSWGDYYRVAPDAENISETAVKSSFIHLVLDLPAGLVPRSLKLVEAEFGKSECLLCGEEIVHCPSPLEAMKKFKLPYLLQPPIELNMEGGWAFSAEQHEEFTRLHWLAPLLLIDEKNRSAFPLKKFTFQLEAVPGRLVSGKVINKQGNRSYLVFAGYPRSDKQETVSKGPLVNCVAATLTSLEGSFELSCPRDAVLTVYEQFPLYDLLEDFHAIRKEIYPADDGKGLHIVLVPEEKIKLKGHLFDTESGETIQGAVIRIFRGEHDPVGDLLIEAYAGETVTGAKGDFSLELPAGKYMLYAAAEVDGRRYKSGEWALKLRQGEEFNRVFSLDQAAVVRGRVNFQGFQPADPPMVALKRYPKVEGEGALTKVPVNRDGSYECLVSFQDRFSIVLEEEGWQAIKDSNNNQGYKLAPQEILERNYQLIPGEED
jgi:hypothetical protein